MHLTPSHYYDLYSKALTPLQQLAQKISRSRSQNYYINQTLQNKQTNK